MEIFQENTVCTIQMIKTYQAPASRQHILPETGTKENVTLARAGVMGMLLGLFAIGKKKDEE